MQDEEETCEEIAWSQIETRLRAALQGSPVQREDRTLTAVLRTQRKKSYVQDLVSAVSGSKSSQLHDWFNIDTATGLAFARIVDPLRAFKEGHWRQQFLSAWILRQAPLPPPCSEVAATALSNALSRSNRSRRKITRASLVRAYLRTSITFEILITLFWIICFCVEPMHGPFLRFFQADIIYSILLGGFVYSIPWLVISWPLSAIYDRNRMNCVRAHLATALGVHPHAQSVCILAETSLDEISDVSNRALESLAKVLPTVGPSHYSQLPPQTVPNLCSLLEHGKQALMRASGRKQKSPMLLILDALAHIGDARAVKTVSRLVSHDTDPIVRARAAEVLTILEERERQETAAKTLLRGSAVPTSRSGDLLRPATAVASETEVLQLLRPVEGE